MAQLISSANNILHRVFSEAFQNVLMNETLFIEQVHISLYLAVRRKCKAIDYEPAWHPLTDEQHFNLQQNLTRLPF